MYFMDSNETIRDNEYYSPSAMVKQVFQNTLKFLQEMPKSIRKKKGQFFTSPETAEFMANMFKIDDLGESISILDPGSGTGILAAALISRLETNSTVSKIHLVCYEMDPDVLPILKTNIAHIINASRIKINADIFEEDYILSQDHDFNSDLLARSNPRKYDLIIGNPPYLRIMRNNPAALAMPTVVHGAPNLYFLFTAMSLFNLKEEKEMVYIIPRSWTSGAYFKAFREYLLSHGKIEQIHLFVSRDQVFKEEQVLQETIIIKIKKTATTPENVLITSSVSAKDFSNIKTLHVPYTSVVAGTDLYVFMPTDEKDIAIIQSVNRYKNTLPDEGFRMRTGIVVDFRQWDDLRREDGENTVPLFYSQHIRDGRVNHQPSGKNFDWISTEKPGLIQKNKNYVFCKRFTAKEERRRLQCGIYLAENFPQYENIGTQNKINYIDDCFGNALSKEEVYGLFVLMNSSLFDMYYRILNGSTQVNSTEINSIPVPPRNIIRQMGNALIEKEDLSTETCDEIMRIAYC